MQLNYNAYLNHTGYSVSAQDYILAMRRCDPDFDIRMQYLHHGTGVGVSKNRRQIFTSLNKKELADEWVSLYHSVPQRYRRPKGTKKHIGVCLFETINPPKEWMEMLNEMDLIITATAFNKGVFESNGVIKPIEVIPHCFDTKLFNQNVQAVGRYRQKTFLSIGTWKNRKNWSSLIKGFYEAFDRKDDVCLLVKTDKPKEIEVEINRIKRVGEWRSKETAPIYTEPNMICDFENIPALMKKGDYFITASMGEGFGLPAFHAMALGIPVITPRFGGSLEYAKPDNCTYIEPDKYKRHRDMDNLRQFRNCIWPYIAVKEIASKMREVFENNPTDKTAKAYDFVHTNFTYEKIGKQFIEVVQA